MNQGKLNELMLLSIQELKMSIDKLENKQTTSYRLNDKFSVNGRQCFVVNVEPLVVKFLDDGTSATLPESYLTTELIVGEYYEFDSETIVQLKAIEDTYMLVATVKNQGKTFYCNPKFLTWIHYKEQVGYIKGTPIYRGTEVLAPSGHKLEYYNGLRPIAKIVSGLSPNLVGLENLVRLEFSDGSTGVYNISHLRLPLQIGTIAGKPVYRGSTMFLSLKISKDRTEYQKVLVLTRESDCTYKVCTPEEFYGIFTAVVNENKLNWKNENV